MARGSEYTYNPETGKWTKSSVTKNNTTTKTNKTTNSDNLTSTNPDKNDSTGSVEKKYNTIEINTLSGTLSFIATKETIKIKAGDTLKILGIGKYLSGNYYVQDIVRQISSDGYTHTATLIKTDFGKSLKTSSKTTKGKTKSGGSGGSGKKKPTKKTTKTKVSSSSSSKNAKRTYTVKKGDCLWNIAKKYYGSGSKWKKIYDANSKKIANPNLIYVGQVLVIP